MKMKRKTMFCMLSLCLLSAASVNAQVTIGGLTDPAAGALLDLNSDVKGGLLLSSIAIADLSEIPANELLGISSAQDVNLDLRGIVVYNTGTPGVPAGIYVWNGYCWSPDGNCTPIITPSPSPAFTIYSSAEYANLAVTADGCPPLTYTWYEHTALSTTGGTPIEGLDPDITTYQTPTGLAGGIHYYYCTVKSDYSNVVATSDLFTVTVQYPCTAAPGITFPTVDQTPDGLPTGTVYSMTVTANLYDAPSVTYLWQSSATGGVSDGEWSDIGGITGSSYNAPTAVAGTTHYRCKVTTACGTATSNKWTVTVLDCSAAPSQPTIDGSASVCFGNSESYSVDNISGVTYTWSFPNDWDDISGQGSSITVTAGSTGGEITVTPSNSCGSGTPQTLTVTVNSAPAQPTIYGSASVCSGTSQSYSVDNVPGVTYTWAVPAGWSAISGQGGNSITVTAGSTGGEITVTPSNSCGNGTPRTLTVTVNSVPAQPGTISKSGSASVQSGSSQTYSVAAVTGATSYEWTLPSGWSGSSTTRSITVTAGTSGGSISVKAKNSCGSSTPQTLTVTTVSSCSGATVYNGAYNGGYSSSSLEGEYSADWSAPGFTPQNKDLCWAATDLSGQKTLLNAGDACWALTTDGVSSGSWRLPNLMEMHVLYKTLGGTGGNQAIDFTVLDTNGTGTANGATAMWTRIYWSDTGNINSGEWFGFSFAGGNRIKGNMNNNGYSRCVRSL
jgi:hypothetical protein